jgi:hypothetical protein
MLYKITNFVNIIILYKIEFNKYETKEAHMELLKYHEKLRYITHGILVKKVKFPVMGY